MEAIVPTLHILWNCIIIVILFLAIFATASHPLFFILSLLISLLKMAFMFLFSYCFSQILGEKCKIEEILKICQCLLDKGL